MHSQNLKGYAVLGNAKILEASTGSWYVVKKKA